MRAKTIFYIALGVILAIAAAGQVRADELPIPKAGLWETKMSMQTPGLPSGAKAIETNDRMCMDQATAKEHRDSMIATKGDDTTCSKKEVKKTAAGYVMDSVCSNKLTGTTTISHAEITGDFNSGFTMKSTFHSEGGKRAARNGSATGSAKYLGACPAGWKPGDVEDRYSGRMSNIKN